MIIRLLEYWYSSQLVYVQWGGFLSSSFGVSNGVKQGGILSPVLFNIYMDELSLRLQKSNVGCNCNGLFINHLVYADDMVLIAPSAGALQSMLNICCDYSVTHSITYNEKKTVTMYIKSAKIKPHHIPCIMLNNKQLSYVDSYKYLGCIISNACSDNMDIKKHIRGLYARANMLSRRFFHCSPEVKMTLFRSYCTNFYCTQLWFNYSKETMRKLCVAYNNTIRKLLGYSRFCSASGMLVETNLASFQCLRRKAVYGFKLRIESSNNLLLQHMYTAVQYTGGPSIVEWNKTLYVFCK